MYNVKPEVTSHAVTQDTNIVMTNPYAPTDVDCQLLLEQKKGLRRGTRKGASRVWPFINNRPGRNVFLATKVTYPG